MTAADDAGGRLTHLEEQMQQIANRLAALEQPSQQSESDAPKRQWHVDRLPAADAPESGDEPSFLIAGQGRLGGSLLAVRQRAGLPQVLGTDPDTVARNFAALASPARITLLRALLHGPRTSQQLRAELDDASAGQLYHHLRELLAAGLIIQPARSRYAIPRKALVMLCTQLVAAGNLAANINLPPENEPSASQPPPENTDPRPSPATDSAS